MVSDSYETEMDKAYIVERVTMKILGKEIDPSPEVNWHCNRQWRVDDVRELVRQALEENVFKPQIQGEEGENGD